MPCPSVMRERAALVKMRKWSQNPKMEKRDIEVRINSREILQGKRLRKFRKEVIDGKLLRGESFAWSATPYLGGGKGEAMA
jgi:hypothetical protein